MSSVPAILTPSATRSVLEQLGHRPRKHLGQNFLVDGNIVRKSIELARITCGDRIVEVGPGLGTLTAALLAAGADVFAVERDPVLSRHLRAAFPSALGARLTLMEGDAVETPLGPLTEMEAAANPFKVVANLPYAISSPWMEAVLAGSHPARMVLMLQFESAQRFAATPGSKSFGAVSVFLQAAFRVAGMHRVSRRCFFPVPEVDSVLIDLERLQSPCRFSDAGRALVRTLFQHRRKQLAPMVRRLVPEVADSWLDLLRSSGIRADVRAEAVPVEGWVALDQLLNGSRPGPSESTPAGPMGPAGRK